ncbi:hypothetical protein GGX14DRAFT_523418, partial [Mycena pura]
MILGWRANLDFRPVLNRDAVIAYVAKYASKAETQSSSMADMLKKAVSSLNDTAPAQVAFQKMLSAFAGERDMSAQETCHILLDCAMVRSSRQVRSVNVSPFDEDVEIDFEGNAVRKTGFRAHYRQRLSAQITDEARALLTNISYIDFLRHWNIRGKKLTRRGRNGAAPYALNVWPRFSCDPEDAETYENWCYARLILHHPFVKESDLLKDHGSWIAAYEVDCVQQNHVHVNDTLPTEADLDTDDANSDNDSDNESLLPDEDDPQLAQFQADWMREAGRGPNQVTNTDTLKKNLGTREIDLNYDWLAHSPPIEHIKTASGWLAEQIKQFPNDSAQTLPPEDYRKLKGDQQKLFLQVMAYVKALKANKSPEPLRINVDGTAGTGKSVLIRAITTAMHEIYADELGGKDPVVRMAPTGVAAFGIKGWTLNFGLTIPV